MYWARGAGPNFELRDDICNGERPPVTGCYGYEPSSPFYNPESNWESSPTASFGNCKVDQKTGRMSSAHDEAFPDQITANIPQRFNPKWTGPQFITGVRSAAVASMTCRYAAEACGRKLSAL